jgi:hypothetical protein
MRSECQDLCCCSQRLHLPGLGTENNQQSTEGTTLIGAGACTSCNQHSVWRQYPPSLHGVTRRPQILLQQPRDTNIQQWCPTGHPQFQSLFESDLLRFEKLRNSQNVTTRPFSSAMAPSLQPQPQSLLRKGCAR